MSEFIAKRKELAVQEYKFMRLLKLFSDKEIKDIQRKRDGLESKIERLSKDLPDYLNYIVYENDLLALLDERRKKLHSHDGKKALEHSIQERIKYLYNKAFERFPNEYRIWLNYIKYCKKCHYVIEGSNALDKMLNFHGDKYEAWINAARWEYEETQNMERVEHFMFRGLQNHPECRELIISFLEIQLSKAENIVKLASKNVETDGMLKHDEKELHKTLECMNILYDNYKGKTKNIKFYLELIPKLSKYPFAKVLCKKVFEDMKEFYPRSETMFNTVAQLALEGSFLIEDEKDIDVDVKFEPIVDESPKKIAKNNIEDCIMTYEAGVTTLKTQKMWTFYIEAMEDLNKDMSTLPKLKRKALGNAYKGAFESGKLSEENYVKYVKMLVRADPILHEFVEEVIEKSKSLYSTSCSVWEAHIFYLIKKNEDHNRINELFQSALPKLGKNSLPLWKMILNYYHTRLDLPGQVETMLKNAIKQPLAPEVSMYCQPIYIEYLALTKNIRIVRDRYTKLVTESPVCLAVHQKMAYLESIQMQPDLTCWRKCHENATMLFGKENVDVWIDYIKFEMNSGAAQKIEEVFNRAKSKLDEHLLPNFITQYEFLKNK